MFWCDGQTQEHKILSECGRFSKVVKTCYPRKEAHGGIYIIVRAVRGTLERGSSARSQFVPSFSEVAVAMAFNDSQKDTATHCVAFLGPYVNFFFFLSLFFPIWKKKNIWRVSTGRNSFGCATHASGSTCMMAKTNGHKDASFQLQLGCSPPPPFSRCGASKKRDYFWRLCAFHAHTHTHTFLLLPAALPLSLCAH